MVLAKIGEYIEVDKFTEAPVIGYESVSGNKYMGFRYDPACLVNGEWFTPHPTDDFGSPIQVEPHTITEKVDMSKMRDIKAYA